MDSVAVVPSARTVIALRAPVGTDEATRDDELNATEELIPDDETTATDELEREELTTGMLLAAELAGVVPPQAAPRIVGRSALPPFFSPCTPNEMDWPTAILPFQLILVAE